MTMTLDDKTTHLFLIRIWTEPAGEREYEWRGKVQYVSSGEAFYFAGWPDLVKCIYRLLRDGQANRTGES